MTQADLPPIPLSIGDRDEIKRQFAESGINKDGLEKMLASGFAFRRNANGEVEMAMHWRWANGRKVLDSFSAEPYEYVLASDPAMRVPVVTGATNAWNDLCGIIQIGRIKFPIEMETSQGVEKFRDVMDMAMRYCDIFDEWHDKLEAERRGRLRTEGELQGAGGMGGA